MSNEQHKARLKHASEVLGWLAEGRELQGRREIVGCDWIGLVPDAVTGWDIPGMVNAILTGAWIYRVKPEPVEFESTVSHLATQLVIFAECGLQFGDKVRVTKIED